MKIIKLLLIEDNKIDAGLILQLIKKIENFSFSTKRIHYLAKINTTLEDFEPDVVLLDLNLPDSAGLNTITRVIDNLKKEIPIIVLTRNTTSYKGEDCLKNGAADFLDKNKLDSDYIEKSIRYSIERNKIYKELNRKVKRLEFAFEASNDSLWDLDKETGEFYFSNKFYETLGYEPGEVVFTPDFLYSLMPEEDRKTFHNHFENLLNNKKNLEIEYRLKAKNGNYIWLLTRGKIIERDKSGKPVRITGTHVNITNIKNIEIQLERERRFIESILEATPAFVFIIDENYKIKYTNKKFNEIFRIENPVGKHCFESIGKKNSAADCCKRKKIFSFNEIKEWEWVSPDKRTFVCYTTSITGANNTKQVLQMGIDITKRKKIEEELKLKMILLDNINDEVIIHDLDGNIIYFNKIAYNMRGIPKKDFNQFNLKDIMNENAQEQMQERFKVLLEKKHAVFESVYVSNKGDKVYLEINARVIEINEKNYIVSVARNVTDRKKAAQEREMLINELEKANYDLKRISKIKDDFLAIASHDLRTPFNAILGFSELLLEDDTLSPEHKELIDPIYQSAETQLKYIDEILSIVALESGEIKLYKIETGIAEIVKSCVFNQELVAKKKQIELSTQIECDMIVQIDASKIIQVVNNLLSNAIKFTPKGGKVKVTCGQAGDNVEIHVIDNGLGISKEDQKIIFNRYEKINSEGTEGETSTGLGLVISKKFVELHNGQIKVSSEKGKGSDFYFSIPKNLKL